jgi:hypothetical protein
MYYNSLYWFAIFFISINANIQKIDVQQNERIRLECTLTSKVDAEEVNFYIRIHSIECLIFFPP